MVNKDKNTKLKSAESILVNESYKLTKPRKFILEFFNKSPRLYDAETLYLEIREKHPEIGIATVYRTLNLFAKLQIIKRIILGSGKTYYSFQEETPNKVFVYMICTRCGKIITHNKCLDDSIILEVDSFKNILKKCGLKVESIQVQFYGLCEECKDKCPAI
jgi:Fur family transcriptional regulator, ferric uptake regulator